MRREHHARLPRMCFAPARKPPGSLPSLLAAVLIAGVLVALAAVPAEAGGDTFRRETTRAVRAHEKARAQVDRLRAGDARTTEVRSAERRRKAIRAGLWDALWSVARDAGDPVAVDPSGRAGRCPAARTRSRTPEDRDGDWTAPTRRYRLSAGYAARGSRWAHRHTGQDFAVPTGTPVYAVGPGTVRATTCGDGFGNQVIVRHPDGYFTQYAHLSRIDVRKGGRVAAGQRLGLSGATGNVTGPHLHFEVRITPYMGSAVSPLPWLRRKSVDIGG
ncbi:M23 family metallopeptidase [Streptomyces galilaeus]|uniref:M23 family metallopeptidase n=1 Tax=Streptomyces bobili TaxID=67280 RepID=A0ABZ1R0A2_9ACTN|nr:MULTISPECIES: M23 family metallopeptidase [Streptomyces]QEU67098.1 M23 family metallopeptidase [Streptomyces galilaeus]